ncbi:MAG: hypothetical protein FWC64_02810 [Treponema sp.]|nr:hypothetical protein [Treponema sp.]
MTRGILIAGNQSPLFSAASAEALKRVEHFASAHIPNRFPLPDGGVPPEARAAKGAFPLSWNPASPISARTLVVAAENRLRQISDAIVICSPPAVFKTAETLTPEDIDVLVNDHIKGWFFLIRELSLYFRRRGAGSLSLIAPEIALDGGAGAGNKSAPADIAGPSAAASFRAFAQGVLASQSGGPFQTFGFTAAETGSEGDFAAWFFKIIDEGAGKNSGRWHKYPRLKIFR